MRTVDYRALIDGGKREEAMQALHAAWDAVACDSAKSPASSSSGPQTRGRIPLRQAAVMGEDDLVKVYVTQTLTLTLTLSPQPVSWQPRR